MIKFLHNRIVALFVAVFILLIVSASSFPINKVSADQTVKEITVFSWEDYIDLGYSYEQDDVPSEYLQDTYTQEELSQSVLDVFEARTGIKVNYYSFATNEEMYNELLKNPKACDIICPSEYMILKMREEGLIKPYTVPDNYELYGSPYIKQVFEEIGMNTPDGKTYAVGYMWGTMGLIYNMEKYSDEDFTHWSNLFDPKFSGKITIKDSLRDSYIMAVAIVYEQELLELKAQFENSEISKATYEEKIFEIFNKTDKDTVNAVGDVLIKLKDNLYGFEVDAGKADLISGKIDVNFAWSGDAVYSMYEAEDLNKELGYVVPEEGSNVWFDGWVMTKDANEELALEFLDFLCDPKIAVRNIDYVGYTSCIGGDDVFDYVVENFSDEGEDLEQVDLKYFFDPTDETGSYIVEVLPENRRFLYAQYADEQTILRCAVMDNFSVKDLELVNEMWNEVKLITLSETVLIVSFSVILMLVVLIVLFKYKDKIFIKGITTDKIKPRRKNCKVIKIEELK